VIVKVVPTAAAVEGPLLLKVTVPVTVLLTLAVAGTETVVVTSAIGVIVVLPLAVSGAALLPSDVDVPMVVLTATGPVAGAV
jgi:hypothetical protein